MDKIAESDRVLALFKNMPKVELHAHLNGSLSQNTLKKLVELKKIRSDFQYNPDVPNISPYDLSSCFKLFNLIHDLTDHPEAIFLATCNVIEEFFYDNVYYLELRTTPKDVGNCMTKDIYVETVLKAIEHSLNKCKDMTVKLILSVDRKRSLEDAQEIIKIAEKYHTSSTTVVGIDFSGDPMSGDVNSFIPILEYAKKTGLKLATHISEVSNVHKEVDQLLKIEPNRLGHGTYLHPAKGGSRDTFVFLQELKIPLEICLTSNIMSKTVPSYEEHHFPLFREIDYPCTLCTDDKGVFSTTLSEEYFLAWKYFSIRETELFDLSFNSINYAFATEEEKGKLKKIWEQYVTAK